MQVDIEITKALNIIKLVEPNVSSLSCLLFNPFNETEHKYAEVNKVADITTGLIIVSFGIMCVWCLHIIL